LVHSIEKTQIFEVRDASTQLSQVVRLNSLENFQVHQNWVPKKATNLKKSQIPSEVIIAPVLASFVVPYPDSNSQFQTPE
jgi:hypothetical protein